jgi:GT2 family glycosyltransferase
MSGAGGAAYEEWVAQHDTLSAADCDAIRRHITVLGQLPLISLVLPLAAPARIDAALAAVRGQLYPGWELIVAAAPAAQHPARAGLASAARDARVRLLPCRAAHPTALANLALDAAQGAFVGFLAPGDLLDARALYEMAVASNAEPRLDLIFSDEDAIDAAGHRSAPRFKPGWDPERALATDSVGAFALFRHALVAELGGLRTETAPAERHDLALRVAARVTSDRIGHIPAVLCHRAAPAAPDPVSAASVRAHLAHRGVAARVTPTGIAFAELAVERALPAPPPLVSVIVPTRDRADLLAVCAEGVLASTDYPALELIVVDNGSREPATAALLALLQRDARVRVLPQPGPFNYAALNNRAAAIARGAVLLLLNNDVEPSSPGWLAAMVAHAMQPDVGAVGAKLLYGDGRVQHGGVVLGPDAAMTHIHRLAAGDDPGYLGQLASARSVAAVTGACLAIRRQVFLEAGGLDETRLKIGFNDVDLCLRLGDLGYRNVWTPRAVLLHRESASRGSDESGEARARNAAEQALMRARWGRLLDEDPQHNPNLRFHWHGFDLPGAPRRPRPWQAFLQC